MPPPHFAALRLSASTLAIAGLGCVEADPNPLKPLASVTTPHDAYSSDPGQNTPDLIDFDHGSPILDPDSSTTITDSGPEPTDWAPTDPPPDEGTPPPPDAGPPPTDPGAPPPPDEGPPPAPDDGPPPAPDPGPPPDPDPPGPTIPEVCYPGPNNTWDVCFDLVPASSINDPDYVWPNAGSAPDPVQYAAPKWLLALDTAPGATKLAQNFALDEFMQAYKGPWAVYSPQAVVHWQAIRSALGVPLHVNSGFRSPGYNSGLDGAATFSRHMYGDAADVTTKGATSLQAIADACYAESADFVKVYTGHVHCDWRYDPLDPGFWAAAAKPGASKPGVGAPADEPAGGGDWPDASVEAPDVVVAGERAVFRAHWTGFDEGTPWTRWEITGPAGEAVIEPATTLTWVFEVPGRHTITWELGGCTSGKIDFVVGHVPPGGGLRP